MPTVYIDRTRADGSGSNQYVYGSKIPSGKVLRITQITAHTYTTNLGDYETSKYINVGVDVNGLKCPLICKDIGTTGTVVFANGVFWAVEGNKPYAYFEATATTTTHILTVNGLLYTKEEFERKYGLATPKA